MDQKETAMGTPTQPTNTWTCHCGNSMARYRGEAEQTCSRCGSWYNACGQRLRDDWQGNPAWSDDDLDDMTGFELQQTAHEHPTG